MLLWNLVRGILPVGYCLHRKIPSFDPLCMRCEAPVETTIHVFRDCPNSSAFWSLLFNHLAPPGFDFHSFFNSSPTDRLCFNLTNSFTWKTIFVVGIWHLWNTRNMAVFENKMLFLNSTFNKFWVDYHHTLNLKQGQAAGSSSSTDSITRKWAPPHKGHFKLNTDGSWMALDNAGGGGVMRCEKGLWQVGFAINFNAMSAAAAELLAIKEGLLIVWARDIKQLELEIDAEALKMMLEDPDAFKNHDLGNAISDVVSIICRNWKVSIFHVNRSINCVADKLAAMGRSKIRRGEISLFHYPPAELFQDYASDIPEMVAI
ncbi:uncharacterized protein LOC110739627 [Chenopodium quinoa]|uniref:uncharacterized protein LOC110739627 n=1 Tax=Chenopodium quinoa TaxID=63459 RepID=UPI000B78D3D9|nr:uncharacterized protein LOC110739627 [Chenopodium quinoa]